jgi:hypothetical protein
MFLWARLLIWAPLLAFAPPALAWGFTTPDKLETSGQREIAARELEQAHQVADEARSAERAAKVELDDFVSRRFEAHPVRVAPLARSSEPLPAAKPTPSPEWVQLNQQLQELVKDRDQLLRRFTAAHPEVTDVEQRIAVHSERLAALEIPRDDAEFLPQGGVAEQVTVPAAAEPLANEHEEHQVFAARYEQVFQRWQVAQRKLQAAIAAEDAAAERLAACDVPEDSKPLAAQNLSPMTEVSDGPQNGSQPLALAALLIALAVAALAAARLARSDSIFSSIDEVAAALALPVVGVIPAMASTSTPARTATRPLVRGTIVVGEIVAAFLVFTLVAYGLQNPAAIWQFCTDPLEAVRRAGDALGGN